MSMLFKRIKDWATSITAFRTGDVIPVDGPNGTAKMAKDDLLRETTQNALAGNIAQDFDPTRTSENPYVAGKDVVVHEGSLYTFKVDHYGAWDPANVEQVLSDWSARKIDDYSNFMLARRYVNTNASVGDSVSIAFTKDLGWSCAVIPCKAGDVFAVTGSGGTNPRLWAVVDSDGKLSAVSNAGVSTSKKIFVNIAVDGTFVYNTSGSAAIKTCLQYRRLDNFSNYVGNAVKGEMSVDATEGYILCADEGETVSPVITPSSSWLCALADCKAGDVFKIVGRGGSGARLWCLIDENNKVVITAPANTYNDSEFTLRIPAAGKLIYNTSKSAPAQEFRKISELNGLVLTEMSKVRSEMSKLTQDVNSGVYYNLPQALTDGAYISLAGDIGDTLTLELIANAGWKCCVIPCEAGDVFEIAGLGGNASRLYGFVDSTDKLTAVSSASMLVTSAIKVVAPSAGKFIFNTSKSANTIICKKRVFVPEAVQQLYNMAYEGESPKMADLDVTLKTFDVSSELENFNLFGGANNTAMQQIYDYLDGVVDDYPDLISKVDAAEEMGMEYPAYASDYRTYLYKISNVNQYVGNGPGEIFEKKKIFLFAGTHGIEIAGCVNVAIFAKRLCANITDDPNLFKLLSAFDFYILPCLNGAGIINSRYVNANGVNINRNYPSSDWVPSGAGTAQWTGDTAGSEFEVQLVMKLCKNIKPAIAFDCHSYFGDSGDKRQFYDTTRISEIRPILYQVLTECSYVFKKDFPQYFGTTYSLLKDVPGEAPKYLGPTPGLFSAWFPEHFDSVGMTVEVSAYINYLNGEPNPGQDHFGATTFAVAEFTLRDHLGRLGEYVLKNDL